MAPILSRPRVLFGPLPDPATVDSKTPSYLKKGDVTLTEVGEQEPALKQEVDFEGDCEIPPSPVEVEVDPNGLYKFPIGAYSREGRQEGVNFVTSVRFLAKRMTKYENWQKLILGPYCFRCYVGNTLLKCENCERHYHGPCTQFGGGFPPPVFDKDVKKTSKLGKVKLLRCCECVVAEQTQVKSLEKFPVEKVNKMVAHICSYLINNGKFKDMIEASLNGRKLPLSLEDILSKAIAGEYKTVEGFCGDLKRMKFDIVLLRGETSQSILVVNHLFRVVKQEFSNVNPCPECYYRRWKELGKTRSKSEYSKAMTRTCQEPHVLVWATYHGFPAWPSKLLSINSAERTGAIYCFRQQTLEFVNLNRLSLFYHKANKKAPKEDHRKNFQGAMKDCLEYLENLETEFGTVNLPKKHERVNGSLLELQKRIYPNYF